MVFIFPQYPGTGPKISEENWSGVLDTGLNPYNLQPHPPLLSPNPSLSHTYTRSRTVTESRAVQRRRLLCYCRLLCANIASDYRSLIEFIFVGSEGLLIFEKCGCSHANNICLLCY
ncbi:Uncharacterized protein Fot_51375 [Forsythia ovata]|uniref:Uncharacterized protein n=1 Tax=Forsythia ovata TaxID=205694 RepID=A0ABD1PV87_9LAMI